ncbi:MAG TPA: hypothetical protein VM537_13705 [Anaerolineae bacterium]|nr:hypothetical protein [Anaerolineae bacterium]
MTEHQMRAARGILQLVELDSMEEAALVLAEALRLKAEQQACQRRKEAAARGRIDTALAAGRRG